MPQTPNNDRELRRTLWDRHGPTNETLRRVVEPLATDFVHAVSNELDGSSERLKALCNTYTLPFGRMSKLPPALFGTITDNTVTLDRPLTVPVDDDEIETMASNYNAWAVNLAQSGNYGYVSIPTSDVLVEAMQQLKGEPYPEEEWHASATATQEALRNEPLLTVDLHRIAQINGDTYELDEVAPDLRALYKQRSLYTLALSQLVPGEGRPAGIREFVLMPIGEYGKEPAERLARAAMLLGDFIGTSTTIDGSIESVTSDEDTKDILIKHTMHTRESYERGDVEHIKNGTSDILVGGILSMTQVISFLTAEKVPGYDDFDTLVADILDSDIIEEFARIAPVGYIGPVTLAGIYVPHALDTSGEKLSLSTELRQHLGEMRRGYFASMAAKWAIYDESPHKRDMPGTLGLTCPASEPNGAITTLRPLLKSFLL